tara:strand:+ start:7255 stop:9123 length:1869 start_codon:yes stop_codon:yes gene_type:complete
MNDDEYRKRCREDVAFAFRHEWNIEAFDYAKGQRGLIPLDITTRQSQVLLAKERQRQLKERGFVRIIILKSRKEGISTEIQAIKLHRCQTTSHTLALTVAHEEDATRELFHIGKTVVEHMTTPHLWPGLKGKPKSNRIEWTNGSRAICGTQGGSADSFRGWTPTFLHISELPSWETRRSQTSAADVAQALLNSVPDTAGTEIYIESTAKGAHGLFFQMWNRAVSDVPGNLYVPMFFAWTNNDIYDRPSGDAAIRLSERKQHENLVDCFKAEDWGGFHAAANELGYSDIQRERAAKYGLRPSQIRYWQETLVNKCNHDQDRFDEEWPVSPGLAFVSSGRSVFALSLLSKLSDKVSEPPRRGTLHRDGASKVRIRDDGGGWAFWKSPIPGHQYLVTADAAGGGHRKEDDFSCIQVFDRAESEQVAEFYAKVFPDTLATQIAMACELYGYQACVCAPECNGPGMLVIASLAQNYPEVQVWRRFSEAGKVITSNQRGPTRTLGYCTTERTRPYMFGLLESAIRNNKVVIHSARLVGELRTLIRAKGSGRIEAAVGCHDDASVALAIALDVHAQQAEQGYQVREEPKKDGRSRRVLEEMGIFPCFQGNTDPELEADHDEGGEEAVWY